MKTKLTTVGTAAVAASMLLAASAQAAGKPADAPKSNAPSPDAAGVQVSRYAAAHHALGSYYDAATKRFVVVAAPGSSLARSRSAPASATVRTRAISKSTVDALQARIAKRAWSPAAKNYTYASWLDLKTGKLVLKTNAPRSVTAPLSKGYAGVVEQQDETVRDTFDRRNDIAPFWGGSSIKSGGAVCTSGFPVQKNGQRFLVTAGHCFSLGAGVTTTDGNLSLGSVVQRGPFFPFNLLPNFDMELIGGASYGSSIYVGGTSSSSAKHINGADDPVVGFTNYCRSGQTSGEQCGETVQSVSAQVCTQTGCKSPVISYTGPLSQPGDSGAPFYVYSVDGSNVFVRGLNIAVGGSTSFAEKWSRISSNLGVSIVT
jgi:hypothetical protein